jgi:hypothetical protein
MKHIAIYISAIVILASHGEPGKQTVKKDNIKTGNVQKDTVKKNSARTKAKVTARIDDTIAIPDDTVPKVVIPAGTIQVGYEQAGYEETNKLNKINILWCSDYNQQDGVGPKDAKLNWKGLFHRNENFYIRSTKLKFIKEHSEMDEEESQKTGWRLECDNKDNNIILIHGAAGLINGPVKKALLSTKLYYAGQKLTFNYYGNRYTLYTTGTKRNGKIYNYKLFLLAKVKGHYYNQLLHSLDADIALDDGGEMAETVEIEFAGDIDGDNIPDFIIDASGFPYGYTHLFLSKPAGSKAILKLVSAFGTSD